MRLRRNVAVGLAGSIWTAVVGLAVVPLYIRHLGVESYGLVGFFVSLQVVLQLLDAGFAATVNREVARYTADGMPAPARTLLRTLGVVYWSMAVAIAAVLALLAPWIATHWLRAGDLDSSALSRDVALMGLAIACRWPLALYQGALMGAQRAATWSAINALMVTLGHVGAVVVLSTVSPTLQAFFTWHAAVALLYALVLREAAWRVLGRDQGPRFDAGTLLGVWRFAAGMSGTAVAATVLTQMDKILLSRLVSLEELGRYTLAGVVAAGLYVFVTPVFNAMYPRFSALVQQGNATMLEQLYRRGARLFATVLFPVTFVIAAFARPLLEAWTGNAVLAGQAAPLVALLVAGTALNGVMHFPYALQLAHGSARMPFLMAATLAGLLGPLIVWLTLRHGAVGAAAAWLTVNVLYLVIGSQVTHLFLLKGLGLRWLIGDIGVPLAVSAAVVMAGTAWLPGAVLPTDAARQLPWAAALWLTAMLAALAASPDLTHWLRGLIGTRGERNRTRDA